MFTHLINHLPTENDDAESHTGFPFELKIMLRLLHFLLLWPVIESHFRVYHSHYPVLNNDHDCFYRFEKSSNGLARHLVPFCIRYNSIYSNGNCFGTEYTYKELRSANITATQLFQWFAPIDMIDDYAAYLLSTIENSNKEQIYCNCTDYGSFGKYCQYQFDLEHEESSFDEIVHQSLLSSGFDQRDVYLINEQNFTTCYTLFNCVTLFGFCLDWREINDGIDHCIDGKDEQDFVDMELNDCDLQSEYRCRNGLCIPRSFLFDQTYDCPDWYDEQYLNSHNDDRSSLACWSKTATAECEEHRFGLNFFSCGDGERLPLTLYREKSCTNLRDIMMLKTLFRPYLNEIINNSSYNDMFHLFGLQCLFSHCPQEILSNRFIPSFTKDDIICPDSYFFFPPGPFVFPFVRLLYKSYDFETNCIRPDFLCWNQSFCNIYHNDAVFEFQSFQCVPIEYFGSSFEYCVEPFYRSFTNLVLIVQTLFSHCTEKKTYSTLYRCKNHLSISPHRIMDAKFDDCSPWEADDEDEEASNHTHMMICHLPDRFLCSDYHCIPRLAIQDTIRDCRDTSYIDEIFGIGCLDEFSCQHLREIDLKNIISSINYQELCDSFDLFDDNKLYR
jgi:hypothetical protein